MPVDLAEPDATKAPLRFYDKRVYKTIENTSVAANGYVNLTIHDKDLTLDYLDINNVQLLQETFTPGINGSLNHHYSDPGVLTAPKGNPKVGG